MSSLPKHTVLSIAATIAIASPQAGAAILYFPDEDIPIPSNFSGVSVDLETGQTSTALDGIPNGDANFFFGGAELSNDADSSVATPSWQPVRAGAGNTDIALNLPVGAVVDASGASSAAGSDYASGFGSSGDATAHFPEFTPGTRGYLGFSLVPNAGGAPLFGWVEVTLQTQASGLEGTIHSWAYESDPGMSIMVGAIPEPATASLALLGALGFALRRRR